MSAVSDEIKRNTVSGEYIAAKAKQKAYARRKYSKYQGMKIVEHPPLRVFVEEKLLEGRSSESIAGRITKREPHLPSISADSILRYLKSPYGRQIEYQRAQLKAKRRYRKKRDLAGALSDRTFIHDRPEEINARSRVGDAEADFIVSGKNGTGRLLVVVDRKLRVSFVEKILPVTVANICEGFLRIKQRYPEIATITTDNDILLAGHQELAGVLGVAIYFCHPYHSWEKGTVENTNGVIRHYVAKSSDISTYAGAFIAEVEAKLNSRYLECLDFATPREALDEHRCNQKAPDVRALVA